MLKKIERLKAIEAVTNQVALSYSKHPDAFTFSRLWYVPRLILEHTRSSGRLALTNISILVSDAALASEDLFIGLLILQNLGIDSRTFLEQNCPTLDDTDCSTVHNTATSNSSGSLGKLMMAQMQRIYGCRPIGHDTVTNSPPPLNPNRPSKNYFTTKCAQAFPDQNLMKLDKVSYSDVDKFEMEYILKHAEANGLSKNHVRSLPDLMWEFTTTFSTKLSSVPSNVHPLRIDLTSGACPERVKLQNYSSPQKEFMRKMMEKLISFEIVYPNTSPPWACAPLIFLVQALWSGALRLTVVQRTSLRFHTTFQCL